MVHGQLDFFLVHPSINRSALLCSIRPDQSHCLLRLFILSFSSMDRFLVPPSFFFNISSECKYMKQQKMNRPWLAGEVASVFVHSVPSVQKISAGGGLNVKDFSWHSIYENTSMYM
jgi:hypothetical protein